MVGNHQLFNVVPGFKRGYHLVSITWLAIGISKNWTIMFKERWKKAKFFKIGMWKNMTINDFIPG